jgi:ACS family hexuronate transporter-like MFS transporter
MVALVVVTVIINYIDRSTLSVIIPHLKDVLSITTEQYSYVVAAFQGAYMLGQPLAGYLLDALGTKIGFAVFATAWSIASILHALSTGWISLAFFRTLLGFSEAAVIPGAMKVTSEWFPDKEKTVASGWINAGVAVGAAIAPPLVIWLLLHASWQMCFVITGMLGFGGVALWLWGYADPKSHPALGEEEREYIRTGQTVRALAHGSSLALLRARNLWGLMISRFLVAPAWATFSFWIPIYLSTERHMSLAEIGLFAWMPFLAADIGSIVGGYMAPFFIRRFGVSTLASRKLVVTCGAVLMIGPACIGLVATKTMAIVLFCVGGFAHQAISSTLIAMATDLFDRREVATASGWTGMAAFLGQLIFSLVIGMAASTEEDMSVRMRAAGSAGGS